eukprot:1367146-Amorphochlora_amoeboformis.AAC.2
MEVVFVSRCLKRDVVISQNLRSLHHRRGFFEENEVYFASIARSYDPVGIGMEKMQFSKPLPPQIDVASKL